MNKSRLYLISIIITLCGFALIPGAIAKIQSNSDKPLLMPGKQSLFQRVLSRPGAMLSEKSGVGGKATPVLPFTAYYVYKRKVVKGKTWVQVGSDSHGTVEGWLPRNQTIPWKQALTVAFRKPIDNDRVLLFKDRESLKKLVDSHDIEAYSQFYKGADKGEAVENSPVIAIQPKAHVDIKDNFYLVPIQQHEDVFLGAEQALMLQVTTVPLTEQKVVPKDVEYQSGLVFVVDSTVSMGPYIDRTREAVRKVYHSIETAGLQNKVNFGLVAYRDNPTNRNGLEYLTKTFANLNTGRDAAGFFNQVNTLKPATISSQDYIEDAYAGVKQALDEIEWRGHDARYIVLITDAGARDSDDPLGKTGMDARALRQLAQDKGVAIWVLHLLTPPGKDNHVSAAAQYNELSYYPGLGSFYYGVGMGEVTEFGGVLDALADQITQQVRDTVNGVPPLAVPDDPEPPESTNEELAKLQQKVAKLGYALRMQYLESTGSEQIPSVFDAWMIDRDFTNPERPTLDVQVLLTRDQLSNMQSVLKQVLETAEEGLLSPSNFINDLKSLAATLSRDPSRVGRTTRTGGGGENLADLGFMSEYIENLPYTGEVMNLSLESWEDWPANRQFDFINNLESKISYYRALHDHTDLWISLDGGSVDGDSVFPISLDALP